MDLVQITALIPFRIESILGPGHRHSQELVPRGARRDFL